MGKVILSKIIEIISGGTPKTSVKEYWADGTIGWLSVTDFNNDFRYVYNSEKKITEAGLSNSNTKLLEKDDIIISARGTVGALAQIGTPMCFNQSCFGLRGKKGIADNSFLYYYLKNYVSNIKRRSQGSVFDTINLQSFDLMEIDIPDFPIQQKIAAVLSALDAKIELNQRINAELESMAKTLYDYWFVQFDFPNEKGKPYKSTGGKMVWNEKLGKKVPEGWEVKSLGKVLKTNLGGTPSTKNAEYWENATIPWLNSGDLTEFPIIKSSSFVTQKGIDNSATTLLPKGSVVISLVRYIRPSIITMDACANQSVVGILETDEIKNTYIYPYLVNDVPRYMALRTGAQQPHINKEVIDETMFYIPPKHILKEYYKVSEPIYKKIINLAFESQTLTELRDWLLPMLMNGQVRVEG